MDTLGPVSRTPSPVPRFYAPERQLKDLHVELPQVELNVMQCLVGWVVQMPSMDTVLQVDPMSAAATPADGDVPPPPPPLPEAKPPALFQTSIGSVGHPHACAQACKYVWKTRGCKDGAACTHCHHCEWHRNEGHRHDRRRQRQTGISRSQAWATSSCRKPAAGQSAHLK